MRDRKQWRIIRYLKCQCFPAILYFDEVPDEIQPGVHVRNVNGRCLSDDEMIAYYTGLAKQYGNLTAYYQNAICLVLDETQIFETMDPSIASEPFLLTDTPQSGKQDFHWTVFH